MYQIARTVAAQRNLDAWDSARLLGLTSLVMADSFIAGFKIRYVYDLWRPVTAIREGDTDGNDATAGDPSWNSLQNTPAVSDYPSTQSTFSGAVAGFGGGLCQLLLLPMCRESMAQTHIVGWCTRYQRIIPV